MLRPQLSELQGQPKLPVYKTKSKQPKIKNNQQRIIKEPDSHLLMEIIRIRAQEKQKRNAEIWDMSQKQLEQFFLNYQTYQQLDLKLQDLIKTKSFKLVKNQNRIYFGELLNQKKHGVGVCIYKDGKVYQGTFKQNQKYGLGYEIYPNGNVYIGQYQKNKKHGLGSFYWFTITSLVPSNHEFTEYYQGQWWGGLPSGKGLHVRSNSDTYQGDFKNGLKHGQGQEHFCNGDIYRGIYVNGLPQGYGQYIWADGSNFKGDFKQGVRNGFGIWKKSKKQNSESFRGHYLLDRKSGYGIYVWQSGEYYKGDFFQDMRHGYGQLYNKQNLIYKGMWVEGKEVPNLPINKRKNNFRQEQNFNPIHDLSQGQIRTNQKKQNYHPRFRTQSKQPKGLRQYTSSDRQIYLGSSNLKKKLKTSNTAYKRSPQRQYQTSKKGNRVLPFEQRINPQDFKSGKKGYGRIGHRNCIPVDNYGKMPKYQKKINRK